MNENEFIKKERILMKWLGCTLMTKLRYISILIFHV